MCVMSITHRQYALSILPVHGETTTWQLRCQSESCIPVNIVPHIHYSLVNNVPPREYCTTIATMQWMLYPIQYLLVNTAPHTIFTSEYCTHTRFTSEYCTHTRFTSEYCTIQYSLVNTVSHTRFTSDYCIPYKIH